MIRLIFRWAFRLLLLAIVLAIGALLLKDTVARHFAEAQIRRETGFDARIGRLEFSLFAPRVTVENLVLYSPAEFGGTPLCDIADLHLEYSRHDLALQRLHLKLLRLDLRELHIVESVQGRTNLVVLLDKIAPETRRNGTSTNHSRYKFAGIEMLNLSVGRVRYTNLRLPNRNQDVNLRVENEIIRNVRTEQDFTAIIFRLLLRAGITIYAEYKPRSSSGNPP